MKTIVTNDEGFEAAKKAYRNTSEVTEIETHNLDALVIQHRESDPWFRATLEEAIVSALADLCKRSFEATGRKVAIIFVPENASLQSLSERDMREAGWVRAKR